MTNKVEITANEGGSFGVRCGELYDDHLTGDEALYVIAGLIIHGFDWVPRYLKTEAQHKAFYDHLRIKREEREHGE